MVQVIGSKSFPEIRRLIFFSVLLFSLQSCGGGGGGSKPSLSIEGTTVTEGDTGNIDMNFTVTLSEDAESDLTLSYSTADGSAKVAEGDYTAVSGSLTIAKGSRASNASIPVYVNADDDFEADETIQLIVNNAQGISLDQASYSGTGTITNDDDADPAGYYTGSANVNGTSLNVTAMVYDKRILMFNIDENVLYDITLDTTLTSFTATAQVYVNGDINNANSLSGLALSGSTDEATITGTFSGGSGLGIGSFTLSFDENNNIGATFSRIVVAGTIQNRWGGDIYGVEVSQDVGRFTPNIDVSPGDEFYLGSDQGSPSCGYSGSLVIPSNDLNIYPLAHNVFSVSSEPNPCLMTSDNHTGFASVVSISGVDTLVYAFTNGSYGFFAIMGKI